MSKYLVKIGLEMHCEMSETNTKVFSPARNDYCETPNTNVNPIDMAFPGVLPLVNKECVKKALMASMILKCSQPEYMYFERKNYYYPDLPKGFQLTQETKPIPVGIYGEVEYELDGELKKCRVNNIHLEEDAASLDHYYDTSNIDYNRAGVPLLELVTEPDLHSSKEAVAFLEHMRSIYQYAGISEADSKKGQLRCDVNVSLMDASLDENDPKNWGTRTEIKNVNSFGGVRDAINYEIERQTEAKENGTYDKVIEQETRRWDEESGTTIRMRSKADAIDYKYFVEPNIPKYKIPKKWLEEIKASIPELAMDRKKKYINEYNLSEYDAGVLTKDKKISDYFEECLSICKDAKASCNWITTRIMGELNKSDEITLDNLFIKADMLASLINLINDKKISNNQGKEVFAKMLEEELTPDEIVKKYDMGVIEDASLIDSLIDEVISENPQPIADYHNGKTNMLDYLVGQVMKKSKGKANPVEAKQKMLEKIK